MNQTKREELGTHYAKYLGTLEEDTDILKVEIKLGNKLDILGATNSKIK